MPANLKACSAFWMASVAILAALGAPALAQEPNQEPALVGVLPYPTQTITLRNGLSTSITVNRSFSKIYIANPDIVDVVAQTDRTAILVPKGPGMTNIDIVDDKAERINSVNILVAGYGTLGRVVIHSGAQLSSYSVYSCAPGCERVEENVSKQPAPTPPPPLNSVILMPAPQQPVKK